MHRDIVYECFGCKFEFDSYKELNQHIKDGHTNTLPAKRYLCKCGKSFTEKYRLNEHQICHDGKKRFVCKHHGCQKAYSGKPELRDHLKIHEGKKGKQILILNSFQYFWHVFLFFCQNSEYFCECGEGFILSRQLRNHRGSLEIIFFSYSLLYLLVLLFNHQSLINQFRFFFFFSVNHHEPQIVHHCSLCSKVFKSKKALKLHMDRHAGKSKLFEQTNYSNTEKRKW